MSQGYPQRPQVVSGKKKVSWKVAGEEEEENRSGIRRYPSFALAKMFFP
jgi:hypothetical protein